MRGFALGIVAVALVVAACATPAPLAERRRRRAPTPSGAGWQPGPEAPVSLIEQATAVHDGRIWIAGGLTAGGEAVDSVYVLDPATGEWTDGPALPERVHHSALVSDGTDLWLLGGYVGDAFDAPTDAVWRLPGGDRPATWEAGPALPEPRAAGAAVWDGTRLVYGGGVGPGVISDLVFALGADEASRRSPGCRAPASIWRPRRDGDGPLVLPRAVARAGSTSNLSRVDVVERRHVRGRRRRCRRRAAASRRSGGRRSGRACSAARRRIAPTATSSASRRTGETSVQPQLLVPRHGFGAAVHRRHGLRRPRRPGARPDRLVDDRDAGAPLAASAAMDASRASSSARVGGCAPARWQVRAATSMATRTVASTSVGVGQLGAAPAGQDPRRQEAAAERVAGADRVDDRPPGARAAGAGRSG